MQIVIDIPQGLKIDFENENWTALSCMEMKDALMNGTPLPKGHGRLIDANEITAFRELECNGHNVESLDEFTVIIEADAERDKE